MELDFKDNSILKVNFKEMEYYTTLIVRYVIQEVGRKTPFMVSVCFTVKIKNL